ncbi:MAG: ABC transporter permease, partial [Clostridiales bacterium]|nr:ABC transporter permease [Clostridiales bacterium]
MSKNVKTSLIWVFVGVMLLLMYAPIVVLIIYSFTDAKALGVWGGFTLELYADLFADSAVLGALGNSMLLAAVSA